MEARLADGGAWVYFAPQQRLSKSTSRKRAKGRSRPSHPGTSAPERALGSAFAFKPRAVLLWRARQKANLERFPKQELHGGDRPVRPSPRASSFAEGRAAAGAALALLRIAKLDLRHNSRDGLGRMGRHALVGLILLTALTGCHRRTSYDNPARNLHPIPPEQIKALTCKFVSRHVADLGDDPGHPRAGDKMSLTFIGLAAHNGRAAVIGNVGQEPVWSRSEAGQFVFIEQTASGNLNATSVFWPTSSRRMAAVHSRHVLVAPGTAVVSQYTGYCDPMV